MTTLLSGPALASQVTQWVTTDMKIPGGTGTFNSFTAPAMSDGKMAFIGQGGYSQIGVYIGNGKTLTTVATEETIVPGTNRKFSGNLLMPAFSDVTIGGGRIGFYGRWGSRWGLFTGDLQGSQLLASGDNLGALLWLRSSNGQLLLGSSTGGGPDSIYQTNGNQLDLVIDSGFKAKKTNNLPAFGSFQPAGFDGKNIAVFKGDRIFARINDRFMEVVSREDRIPDGVKSFTALGNRPDIEGDTVVFVGWGLEGQEGVYRWQNGILTTLANERSQLSGGTKLTQFETPIIAKGQVVFMAKSQEMGFPNGIYMAKDGEVMRLVKEGDKFGNRQIINLEMGPEGFDGDQVAFVVEFRDGSKAIYSKKIK